MNPACLIKIDTPGSGRNRLMAKTLVMSLVRSHFDGDIIIFRSGEVPVFHDSRLGIQEYPLPVAERVAVRGLAEEAWGWKYRVAGAVPEYLWRLHSQWVMLNREMVAALLSADMTEAWSQCFAADESLFGTQLALMGYPLKERALPGK